MDKTFVLIVAAGERPSRKTLRKFCNKAIYVIAADKGGQYLKTVGIAPRILVGDLDSISQNSLRWLKRKKVEILSTSCNKDETDTMLAVLSAKHLGAKQVLILGGLGARLDHTIANIALLHFAKKMGIKAYLLDEKNTCYILDSYETLHLKRNDTISIFAVTQECVFEYSSGLKYPLDGLTLYAHTPIGVSNLCLDDIVTISILSGEAMVVTSI